MRACCSVYVKVGELVDETDGVYKVAAKVAWLVSSLVVFSVEK